MSQPYWRPDPYQPPPRAGLGLGAGAGLGALVGIVGPILLGLLGWGATTVLQASVAESVNGLVIIAIVVLPIVLLIGGCLLMIPDHTRGWGVAALTASGVWLISAAGVCTVALFGALASYDNSGMVGL